MNEQSGPLPFTKFLLCARKYTTWWLPNLFTALALLFPFYR